MAEIKYLKKISSEQTGLLKTEIRRLEKNQERKDNIHNLEYLKNVILKFMTLQPGTEKTGLIPVLETMLQVKILTLISSRFTLISPQLTLTLPPFTLTSPHLPSLYQPLHSFFLRISLFTLSLPPVYPDF